MQDWNYLHSNCFEITVEQGCFKFPYANQLESIWNANKPALINYIWQVHNGVAGFIKDTSGNGIPGAAIEVAGRDHSITSAKDGDYWRLLVPGNYSIVVSALGYQSVLAMVTVPEEGSVSLNFTLHRDEEEVTDAEGNANLTTSQQNDFVIVSASTESSEDITTDKPNFMMTTIGSTSHDKYSHIRIFVISVSLLMAICIMMATLGAIVVITICHIKRVRPLRKGFTPLQVRVTSTDTFPEAKMVPSRSSDGQYAPVQD